MTPTPDSVYKTSREQETFLALRELLAKNACAAALSSETLAKLLVAEKLVSFRVEAHEVEVALEALRAEDEFLA